MTRNFSQALPTLRCPSLVPWSGRQAGGHFFKHVHSSELNVYDFTTLGARAPRRVPQDHEVTTMGYVLKPWFCVRNFSQHFGACFRRNAAVMFYANLLRNLDVD